MTDVNRSDQDDARVLTVTSIIDVNYSANQSATEYKLRPIRLEYEKGKLTLVDYAESVFRVRNRKNSVYAI